MNPLLVIQTLLHTASALANLADNLRTAARQNAELTPAEDAALDLRIRSMLQADHWQPAPPPPTAIPPTSQP